MATRKSKREGRRNERGGRISEGRTMRRMKGYRELARRLRIGGREIDGLLQRGKQKIHLENTMRTVTLPMLKGYWNKFNQTRIATGANRLFVRGSSYTGPAKAFARAKGIRLL